LHFGFQNAPEFEVGGRHLGFLAPAPVHNVVLIPLISDHRKAGLFRLLRSHVLQSSSRNYPSPHEPTPISTQPFILVPQY
jgi:hypothetical protein